ncbi:unnamed protein product [Rotaria socialis]
MHMDISKYLLIVIGCFVRSSSQLYCVQCTSSIEISSSSWDHSCLDGNLTPLLCVDQNNKSESISPLCMSAVYTINKRAGALRIKQITEKIIYSNHPRLYSSAYDST